MYCEAQSASDAVRSQLDDDADDIAALGAVLRRLAPRAVVTCARGSSECAAELGPILLVQNAYRRIANLAISRGFDPDRPASLSKVTETL